MTVEFIGGPMDGTRMVMALIPEEYVHVSNAPRGGTAHAVYKRGRREDREPHDVYRMDRWQQT